MYHTCWLHWLNYRGAVFWMISQDGVRKGKSDVILSELFRNSFHMKSQTDRMTIVLSRVTRNVGPEERRDCYSRLTAA